MEYSNDCLIVDFRDTRKSDIDKFINDSDFLCFDIGDNRYLFPCPEDEYDILEKYLTNEFILFDINSFIFEGV